MKEEKRGDGGKKVDKDAKEERKREKGSLEEEQSIHSLHSADSNGFIGGIN